MQELDETLWRDVPGHAGYQAHPEGFVRSFWKRGGDVRKFGVRLGDKPCLISNRASKHNGYTFMTFKGGLQSTLHRVMAETFLPNPSGLQTVNHKDGDRTNNRLENLEWMSHQDNLLHKHRVLKKQIGETTGTAKLSNDDAVDVFVLHKMGARSCDLADSFGISRSAVCHIVHGRTWNHLTHAA